MAINQQGLELVKKFEGLYLKAYKCPAGVLTIGYGHTKGVKEGQTITEKQAEKYLLQDLEQAEKQVDKYQKKYNFNDNQRSALVSFAFNIGNIDGLTCKGKRTIQEISDKLTSYSYANGKYLSGLYNRRVAERLLFNQAVVEDGKKVVKVNTKGGNLNLRKSPSMCGKVYKSVPNGTRLNLIEPLKNGWVKVKYDGKELYCATNYIKGV